MSADAVRVRAGISRLREQAEAAAAEGWWQDAWAAHTDGGFDDIAAVHIARWSPDGILALCGYLDQQTDTHEQTLWLHRPNAYLSRCYLDDCTWPCADVCRAEAALTSLAALITTIEGAS